ncbi:hypothetical protein [Sandaracinus amylolyticus]|uniref:hypothetical protein n=1 Tax=Sandaracinus amylolyticus TaxID=927083 RepID=UPI001F2914AE|nr:hypothetical protein [Sandaracinus amylolyticus]UJR82795.1 Hypothetical protein I5071_48600 [Sandaracinus amylolyticus]
MRDVVAIFALLVVGACNEREADCAELGRRCLRGELMVDRYVCWDGEREMEWLCDPPRDGGVWSGDASVDAATDSGALDAGAFDSGVVLDGGALIDSSVAVDSGAATDSGGAADSGAAIVDAGAIVDSGPPDSGTPAEMRYCVDIDVSNTCVMSVSPREITIPAGQTAYFCWRNRSRDYAIDVWLSYGGGYTELAPGATWNEPIGHCLGPNAHDEHADIDTACSSHRFVIHCL